MKNIYSIFLCIVIAFVVFLLIISSSFRGPDLYGPVNNSNNLEREPPKALYKTIYIISANCSGSPNIIKFRIKHTGTIDIEPGELYAYLDGKNITTTPDILKYSLKVGNISTEFSYNDTENNEKATLTVGSPAGEISQDLICS